MPGHRPLGAFAPALVARFAWVIAVVAAVLLPRVARACGWDWETYHAEARALPCVFDAILGFYPRHSDEYHQRRIAAVDHALAWMPGWTEGLDARGISALKLGDLEGARATMERRLALAPAAYASHANLGTLFTFTGEFAAALEHIDAALAIEPAAHFGREKIHRALVVFLQRVAADPEVATTENFLGITMSAGERRTGSPALARRLGVDEDAVDAMVAMITVYGADRLPELYLTLGEALAARGHRRLAYSAYRRARELGHPRRRELGRWMKELAAAIKTERTPDGGRGPLGELAPFRRDAYRGIGELYVRTLREGAAAREKYQVWERAAVADGLAIWSAAGVDAVYAKMDASRPRCRAPDVLGDPRGGSLPDPQGEDADGAKGEGAGDRQADAAMKGGRG